MTFRHAHGGEFGAQIVGEQFALACTGDGLFHLTDCLVEQEIGRNHAHASGSLDPFQLAIEDGGHLFHAFDIRVGIIAIFDLVIRLHEARQGEVLTDILDHDVGRRAPVADRRIAIGQGKSIERHFVSAFDDFQIGQIFAVEPVPRNGSHQFEVSAKGCGIGFLPSNRLIFEFAAQAVMAARIDTQRCRPLRLVFEKIIPDDLEQPFHAHGLGLGNRSGASGGGTSGQSEGRGCAEA